MEEIREMIWVVVGLTECRQGREHMQDGPGTRRIPQKQELQARLHDSAGQPEFPTSRGGPGHHTGYEMER